MMRDTTLQNTHKTKASYKMEKKMKMWCRNSGGGEGVVTDAAKTQKISSMFPVGPDWPPGRAAVMFQNFNNIHILS